MNSETHDALEQIAGKAGAIARCGTCGSYTVRVEDQESDRRAYAMATAAWQREEFRGDTRQDIMDAMKSVLDDANWECPGCR